MLIKFKCHYSYPMVVTFEMDHHDRFQIVQCHDAGQCFVYKCTSCSRLLTHHCLTGNSGCAMTSKNPITRSHNRKQRWVICADPIREKTMGLERRRNPWFTGYSGLVNSCHCGTPRLGTATSGHSCAVPVCQRNQEGPDLASTAHATYWWFWLQRHKPFSILKKKKKKNMMILSRASHFCLTKY